MSRKNTTRTLQVLSSSRITPNMQRVTLTGEELRGFPKGENGAHIKLTIPESNQSWKDFKLMLASGEKKPTVRTYTVRNFRMDSNELDVDFAIHGKNGGPASNWAVSAREGDFIGVSDPGSKKLTSIDADWFLFLADMTAIPAAAAALEQLPKDAVGVAVFEITTEADRQKIEAPKGIEFHWLIHPSPSEPSRQQVEIIENILLPSGEPSIFVAGESGVVKQIRRYIRRERKISKQALYASAYWKIGMKEEEHQIHKYQGQTSSA